MPNGGLYAKIPARRGRTSRPEPAPASCPRVPNLEIASRARCTVDDVGRNFDGWALDGRSERMEQEHGKTVVGFLQGVRFRRPFEFLDVGCGNGWLVRRAAGMKGCTRAVGIDKSANMIQLASSLAGPKEEFFRTGLEEWSGGPFDYAFSMEAIYYSPSVGAAVSSVYSLLRKGGTFFCGTDYYGENTATAGWPKRCGMEMQLLSEEEWRAAFRGAGFRVSSRRVTDPRGRAAWRREMGTLFITGKKPS
ncbi:SAM dependent methyltransferase [Cenarchaeum symbiosum A]|uniref:SAM dependent methyltransferase n=1 Tax=Cenarchaeum symbiosum (strain A) TaxID=414004 RepID=A0RX70_CENSY|nr:SAM dependent methyltransferase [Cenarchaeum symbiosum A]